MNDEIQLVWCIIFYTKLALSCNVNLLGCEDVDENNAKLVSDKKRKTFVNYSRRESPANYSPVSSHSANSYDKRAPVSDCPNINLLPWQRCRHLLPRIISRVFPGKRRERRIRPSVCRSSNSNHAIVYIDSDYSPVGRFEKPPIAYDDAGA